MKEKEEETKTLIVFVCEMGSKALNSVMDATTSFLGKRMVLRDGREEKIPVLATKELTSEDKEYISSLDDTIHSVFIEMAEGDINRNYIDAIEVAEED